jgi:enoyl-CoA hydratase/carnithine racemase
MYEGSFKGLELPLAEGLALETEHFASLFATHDAKEGTSAFLEKRKPVFKGT